MKKVFGALFALLLALVGAVGLAPSASAAGHYQVLCNSTASDGRVFVTQFNDTSYLDPGECRDVTTAAARSVVVNGYSFRVRYDANSGPYQACQNIPGSKRFTPASGPNVIWFLQYARSNCKHPSAGAASGQVPLRADQTTRLKMSAYGPSVQYDTDYRNGYTWKTFKRGTSRNFDSNDVIKSNAQSFALVRSLYRVTCYNMSPNKAIRIPPNEDDATLQTYPKDGCKN